MTAKDKFDLELSTREKAVARGRIEGHTVKEVAEDLGLSPHTVKVYILRIYKKTGVSSVHALREYFNAEQGAFTVRPLIEALRHLKAKEVSFGSGQYFEQEGAVATLQWVLDLAAGVVDAKEHPYPPVLGE